MIFFFNIVWRKGKNILEKKVFPFAIFRWFPKIIFLTLRFTLLYFITCMSVKLHNKTKR